MPPHMICVMPFLTSNATVRHLRILLPRVACLLDGEKYFQPDDLPPPAGDWADFDQFLGILALPHRDV